MPANVDITSIPLPLSHWEGTLQDLLDLFAEHMEGTFTGNVLIGQTGGTAPTSNVGLWVNGNVVYSWNTEEARYLPMPLAIGRVHTGGVMNITSILSSATANRELYTPDKNGTLATTADVFDGQPTSTLGGATPSVDWNIDAKNFYLTLEANSTITHTNAVDGQEKHLWIENPASSVYTVTWAGEVLWPAGTAPVQTTAGAGERRIDHYKFWKIGDRMFGERVANYVISTSGGSGGDVTPPVVIGLTVVSGGTITVTFNELLQGSSHTTGNFLVKENGDSRGVTSVTSSGNRITIVTTMTTTASDSVTLQYTGASIKDVAGNVATVFGPSPVTYISSGGGGGGGGGQNLPH